MKLSDLVKMLSEEERPHGMLPAPPHVYWGWRDTDGDGIPDKFDPSWSGDGLPNPINWGNGGDNMDPWLQLLMDIWESIGGIPQWTMEDWLEFGRDLILDEGIDGLLWWFATKFPNLVGGVLGLLMLDDNIGDGTLLLQDPRFVDGYYPGIDGFWFYNPDFRWGGNWQGVYPNPWDPSTWEGWQVVAPPYGPPGFPGVDYLWPPPEGYDAWDPSTWDLPPGFDPNDESTWGGNWGRDPDTGEWIPVPDGHPGWSFTDEGWVLDDPNWVEGSDGVWYPIVPELPPDYDGDGIPDVDPNDPDRFNMGMGDGVNMIQTIDQQNQEPPMQMRDTGRIANSPAQMMTMDTLRNMAGGR